jgi:hypothetical protein
VRQPQDKAPAASAERSLVPCRSLTQAGKRLKNGVFALD